MLPYYHSMWIYGDDVGPKYALVSVVNGREMPKSSYASLKLMSLVRIGYPPNLMPRMAV